MERSGRTAQGYRGFRCRVWGKRFNKRSSTVLNRVQFLSDVRRLRWFPDSGQAVKLGSPDEKDGPDDGQAEAVWG